jgi:hypothetical protein
LTEFIYRVWQSKGYQFYSSQTIVNELIIPAAWVATHSTRTIVVQSIASIKDTVMRRIIERDNSDAGSQATFAVLIFDGTNISACWMGNTRIMISTKQDELPSWGLGKNYIQATTQPFTAYDENFTSDKIRFSSHPGLTPAHLGLRGAPVSHECTVHSNPLRIAIHSDALESMAVNMYNTKLDQHIVLSDAELAASTAKDDTTLLDIRIEKQP